MRMPLHCINQLIMETMRKNVNKDGICLLGSRPIDQKQRIIIFKHRDETEVSKILRKFKGDGVFLGCVVFISTVCIIKCVSRSLYLTNTTKSETAVSI